jgi:hypothetical protein
LHGHKRLQQFTWGSKPDQMITLNKDIILEKVAVEPMNSQGNFGLI